VETLAPLGTGQFGTVSDAARVEVGLVVAVAVLGALLVAVRSNRAAATHRRQAAGTVYFDHDAAHYGPGGRRTATTGIDPAAGRGPARRPRPGTARAMAPSFTAPVPARRHRVGRPGPAGPPAMTDAPRRAPPPGCTG
jgi:hypothetical protein